MNLETVHDDLLEQDVECIVNAWNRNLFPWWLLMPQGVSKAIRMRAGSGRFKSYASMASFRSELRFSRDRDRCLSQESSTSQGSG